MLQLSTTGIVNAEGNFVFSTKVRASGRRRNSLLGGEVTQSGEAVLGEGAKRLLPRSPRRRRRGGQPNDKPTQKNHREATAVEIPRIKEMTDVKTKETIAERSLADLTENGTVTGSATETEVIRGDDDRNRKVTFAHKFERKQLKSTCEILDQPKSRTKDDILDRIIEFVESKDLSRPKRTNLKDDTSSDEEFQPNQSDESSSKRKKSPVKSNNKAKAKVPRERGAAHRQPPKKIPSRWKKSKESSEEQMEEQTLAAERTAVAETRRLELAKEQQDMKMPLEHLNESIEKSFIRMEIQIETQPTTTVSHKN